MIMIGISCKFHIEVLVIHYRNTCKFMTGEMASMEESNLAVRT